jgi:hypothetical protein
MLLSKPFVIAALSLTTVAFAASQPANMSGKWKLDLDKSKWGKRDKPTSADIQIEQQDTSFRYKGSVLNADGSDARSFEFDGAIDGKSYPVTGPQGGGSITIKRVNDNTIQSHYTSKDGRSFEDATTSISKDGKQLTRRVHRKGPEGDFSWIEVYERLG